MWNGDFVSTQSTCEQPFNTIPPKPSLNAGAGWVDRPSVLLPPRFPAHQPCQNRCHPNWLGLDTIDDVTRRRTSQRQVRSMILNASRWLISSQSDASASSASKSVSLPRLWRGKGKLQEAPPKTAMIWGLRRLRRMGEIDYADERWEHVVFLRTANEKI